MSSPNDLINKVGSLSSLPDSYHRVDAAVSDSSGSARDIAEAIEMDQSMSARVLRLANSSMYAFPARVDTITRAVTIIGTKQIKDLALATCILDMFDGLEDESLDAKGLWHGAFATGCLARILSVKSREQNPERFFCVRYARHPWSFNYGPS